MQHEIEEKERRRVARRDDEIERVLVDVMSTAVQLVEDVRREHAEQSGEEEEDDELSPLSIAGVREEEPDEEED